MSEQEFALLCAVIFTAQVLPWWLAAVAAVIFYIMTFTGGRE